MKNELLLTGLCLSVAVGSGCSSEEGPKRRVVDPSTSPAGENTSGEADANSGGSASTDATQGGTSGVDGGGTSGPSEPKLADGCPGQKLREGIPTELEKPGPWSVGAVTTMLGGVVTEVWYPAEFGSTAGKKTIEYDMREHLPPDDAAKIPDDHVPTHPCNCYSKLPLDTKAGPYPVLLFVHGTAGFRTTNVENMTHWASRGFVVVAADHPGIQLKDMLVTFGLGGNDQAGEATKMLTELALTAGDLAFLKDHIDMKKVGLMGHSAGARAVSMLGALADVIIPYAGGDAITTGRVQSVLYATGDKDAAINPTTNSYDATTKAPKRRIWITKGGHLVGGNLCTMRDPQDPKKDIVDLAEEYKLGGVLGAVPGALRTAFGTLFDGCNELQDDKDPFIPASRGIQILNFASAGQFEEALHCSPTAAAQLAKAKEVFGDDVSQYAEDMP